MGQMNKYTISDFENLLKKEGLLVESETYGKEDTMVSELTYDSRDVKKHTMFICKGSTFKTEYLQEALENGGVGYISEVRYDLSDAIPFLIVKDIRKAMGILANWFFDYAWKKLKVTAVGGTKGKSTTTFYIKSILDEYLVSMGQKESGVISSIEVYDGSGSEEAHNTTPEAIELQKHFRNAVDHGMEYVEMEVSSQGLKYGRLDGIRYDVGIFLNISEDHISPVEHPDFEDYLQSKLWMFAQTDTAIVNLETDEIERVLESARKCKHLITFSTKNEQADYYGYHIRKEGHGICFDVKCKEFEQEFTLSMPGIFNVENALAAIATARAYQIPLEYIVSGLRTARVRGRMEIYTSQDHQIIAIVDYAHNKLSFEKLFESVQEEYPDYERICVFGCPGKKAYVRRKFLGTIAGENADRIILTSDEPGLEPVEEICADIAQYIAATCPYEIVIDRTEAIRKAIETAEGKTVILIAGKGHETSMKIGTEYMDYPSDAVNAIRFLEEYDKQQLERI